jgi:DNA-binding transcriptional ArsR family regulator
VPRAASAAASVVDPAPLFAALGDPTRLRLVTRLASEGPQSITRLARTAPVTRQAITKHLRALAEAGVVRGRRAGRESVWELQPDRLEQARQHLDVISRQWDAAIERLRALVESDPG